LETRTISGNQSEHHVEKCTTLSIKLPDLTPTESPLHVNEQV